MSALFSIVCTTCRARLKVRQTSAIGQILACPKCGSMVQVVPPDDWQPPTEMAASQTVEAGHESDVIWAQDVTKIEPPPLPAHLAASSDEPAPQPGGWLSSTERRGQRLAMFGAMAFGGAVVAFGAWSYFASRERPQEPAPVAVAAADVDEAPNDADEPAPLPEARDDPPQRRWIPRGTQQVVDRRFKGAPDQSVAAPLLERLAPWCDRATADLLSAMRLEPRSVERLSWYVLEPESAAAVVAIVQLRDGESVDATLAAATISEETTLAGLPVHRIAGGAWPHPILAVDARRLITGPRAILKELAENEEAFDFPAVVRLVDLTTSDSELRIVADRGESRDQEALPPFFLPDDEAARDAWRVVWRTPAAWGLSVWADQQVVHATIEMQCDGETAAQEVYDALERLLPLARESLRGEARAVLDQLLAGTLKAAAAAEVDQLIKGLLTAAENSRVDLDATTVRLLIDVPGEAAEWARVIRASVPILEAQQVAALERGDRQRHQRILDGLRSFERAEGALPVGAAGAVQLAPESRLSWIASTLPFLGHLDWHGELNFRRPWNSPHNRGVAMRPLEEMINPLLGAAQTEAGFPVTHYVGLAGVGADAGELPADDPRAGVFGFRRQIATSAIGDGASNTIAIVGVSDQLGPWAAGGQATVRALTQRPYINGPDGFGSGQQDGMLVGMADGSVRFISADVDPRVLERLATINGGETVDLASLEAPQIAARPTEPVSDEPHAPTTDTAASTPDTTVPSPDDPLASDPAETPRPSTPQWDVDEQLAMPVVGVEFNDVPLNRVVEFLAQSSRLAIMLDVEALIELGVAPDSPVSIRLADATLGELLAAVTEEQGLALEVDGNQLIITSPKHEREVMRRGRVPVGDLVRSHHESAAELVVLIREFVEPSAWREAGGRGRIVLNDDHLEVEQAATVIAAVEDFCNRLRLARGLPTLDRHAAAPTELASRYRRALPLLEAKVTANFPRPTRLTQLTDYLASRTGVRLLVDWINLAAVGLPRDAETTLQVSDAPLEAALMALAGPLDLAVRILDGRTLQLTTRDVLAGQLEVEFYPVAELLAAGQEGEPRTAEQLIDAIKHQVQGATWSDAGGFGRIHYDPAGSCLIVLQSQPAQIDIERLLDSFRGRAEEASAAE